MEQIELKMLQALPLDVKILKTKQRIREWYEYYNGKVYVSFSGGKDSTVLLDIVRSIYPKIQAVFADTGLEFPEIRSFVKQTENVVWLKPKLGFKQVIEKYGYPVIGKETAHGVKYAQKKDNSKSCLYYLKRFDGTLLKPDGTKSIYNAEKYKFLLDAPYKISDECCNVMKKKPIHKYERETGYVPFIGTMAGESRLRKTKYLRVGCNSFKQNNPQSTPIGFWTEKDIWDYIKLYNTPYSKIYDMGYERTGCMFCMFGAHLEKGKNRFQTMQSTHPKQYEYCMKNIEQGGLGLAKVLDYINVSYRDDLDDKKTAEGVNYQQYRIT